MSTQEQEQEQEAVLEPLQPFSGLDTRRQPKFQEATVWWVYCIIMLVLLTCAFEIVSHLNIHSYDHVDVYVPLHKNYTGLNPTGTGYSESPQGDTQ